METLLTPFFGQTRRARLPTWQCGRHRRPEPVRLSTRTHPRQGTGRRRRCHRGGSRSLKRLNSKHHLNEGSLDRSAVCLVNGTNPGAIALQRIPFAP